MSNARIEEVSDSDPDIDDISDVASDFSDRDIIKQRAAPAPSAASFINPSAIPSQHDSAQYRQAIDESKYKDFQCLYPVYFDATRSRGEGRRVGAKLAVKSPLAREIAAACSRLGIESLFEPTKTHPRDWANPGRVKVKLRGGPNHNVKNKHHLYIQVSKYLQENPTTEQKAAALQIPGLPPHDTTKPWPKPDAPKGWKMSEILPYHSAAISGGGVSENLLQDMMGGMGGQMPPELAGMASMMGGGQPATPPSMKEKKVKKKVIRA